jgi:hypothetical protein
MQRLDLGLVDQAVPPGLCEVQGIDRQSPKDQVAASQAGSAQEPL